MGIIETLQKKNLQRKLKKARGKSREAIQRDLNIIKQNAAKREAIASIERKTLFEERKKQAQQLAIKKAQIEADVKLKKIKAKATSGGISGSIAKFVSAPPSIPFGPAGRGTGGSGFDVIGNKSGGGKPFDVVGNSNIKRKGGFKIV